jgi:hypothetical protein
MEQDIKLDLAKSEYCAYCTQICFHNLPYEDEPGVSHHPSFASLKVSARTCILCWLIYQGICRTRAELRGQSESVWTLYDGKSSTKVIFGRYAPGSAYLSSGMSGRSQPMNAVFLSDDKLKPWLYGNWYLSDENEKLLIGMGVRLGESPELVAAEGNSEGKITLRGSQLRLRTAESKYHSSCERLNGALLNW